MTKTFAFSKLGPDGQRYVQLEMDVLAGLERAAKSKLARMPRRLGYRSAARWGEKKCCKCGGCEATFNIDWRPYCDACHTYEQEVRRLEALVQHYKNMSSVGGPRAI